MDSHWHVATGLASYGPEGSDGFGTATDAQSLATMIADELRQAAESEFESASAIAGDDREDKTRDYHDAWWTMQRGHDLETLAMNFDYDSRAKAPLYVDAPEKLAETVYRLATEKFPLDISHNSRLHVWRCPERKCEHLAELDE